MKASSSFTRCGVCAWYRSHTLCTMACASAELRAAALPLAEVDEELRGLVPEGLEADEDEEEGRTGAEAAEVVVCWWEAALAGKAAGEGWRAERFLGAILEVDGRVNWAVLGVDVRGLAVIVLLTMCIQRGQLSVVSCQARTTWRRKGGPRLAYEHRRASPHSAELPLRSTPSATCPHSSSQAKHPRNPHPSSPIIASSLARKWYSLTAPLLVLPHSRRQPHRPTDFRCLHPS